MAYPLFIDESGHDRKESPYEVLAGVAVLDSQLWPLINDLHAAEIRRFGRRYSFGTSELKATKILKRKIFQHASLNALVRDEDISQLAKEALDNGPDATIQHLKALALAKINYVRDVFAICRDHGCKAFASIIETDAADTETDGLRKDYAYLFERFFTFLRMPAVAIWASWSSTNWTRPKAISSLIKRTNTSRTQQLDAKGLPSFCPNRFSSTAT